ncbi:molybdopterin-dependent oxidoreductase [Williamsia sp.]|uniref:molybdopterin-dependent oxidoreductase n=1 Tax=Williamsia sp. TaxID=1872085 RepID=UPI001A332B8E|nr:molybdopterin-dependent oxidoreductase [Williamsia sp.]MBJ7291288.1 molybdopterin-dependent oxidoreductase [Williamsia sp.]
MSGSPEDPSAGPSHGKPVGRRIFLGLVGLGAVGVVAGSEAQNALSRWLAPVMANDPTGLVALLPLGDTFRFYSVVGSVERRDGGDYSLTVGGEVATPAKYSLADLQRMPQTNLTETFHCVTGWRVPDVPWTGVRLSTLIDRAAPRSGATAVRFRSFDGTYTESLPLDKARRADCLVALRMLDAPVTHDHGGPVRMYVGGQYGYKSTKWLSGIELTTEEIPGYWERRGYELDGTIDE